MSSGLKIKLDENIGARGVELFRKAGFDVSTVSEQGLSAASDHSLINTCRGENRCLVTFDLDFSNPIVFRPADYSGIAVLRIPPKPATDDIFSAVRTLIQGLSSSDIRGKLWIVQKEQIREYQSEEEE